jgi:hypothetical protein
MITMTYNKPELVTLEKAAMAIQGTDKSESPLADGSIFDLSVNAYQADE